MEGPALTAAKRSHKLLAPALALASLVLVVLAAGCGSSTAREFPSYVYGSSTSLAAYRTAAENPAVLEAVPCYCGCGPSLEHRSLKECFITPEGTFDQHAALCDLCQKEASDAVKWYAGNSDLGLTRALIDEKYQGYGTPTETPPP